MNKLITSSNGGFPYKLDDLRFEQEAVRNAFLGFITGFGITAAESFIISGCEVTGDYIAEGYICLEGEICKVDAHTMPTPGGGEVRYFELAISYDPAGFKQFENSTTGETYQVRKATILAGVGTGKFLLTGAEKLGNKIDKITLTNWKKTLLSKSAIGGDVYGDINIEEDAKYLVIGKTMFLNFHVKVEIGTTGVSAIKLGLPASNVRTTHYSDPSIYSKAQIDATTFFDISMKLMDDHILVSKLSGTNFTQYDTLFIGGCFTFDID